MANITIKDIAKALNLSTSTVSRALRDSYEISTETKNRVLHYAEEVKYTPNPIALSLKENKSHSICVIVPEIANNFFSEVINGIDDIAYKRGYHVVIFQNHESFLRERENIKNAISRRADGIIMSLSSTNENLAFLRALKEDNLPMVYFDRVPPFEDVNKVVVDNFAGSYAGTEYLVKKGKKKIAHISISTALSITYERLEGYKACLQSNGIPIDEDLIKFCTFDPEEINNTIEQLIFDKYPDSFFIVSDRLALNSIAIIRKHLDKLSKDLEIVGFTNMKYANLLYPPIHTIRQPAFEIGKQAAQILINTIESKFKKLTSETLVLTTEFVEI